MFGDRFFNGSDLARSQFAFDQIIDLQKEFALGIRQLLRIEAGQNAFQFGQRVDDFTFLDAGSQVKRSVRPTLVDTSHEKKLSMIEVVDRMVALLRQIERWNVSRSFELYLQKAPKSETRRIYGAYCQQRRRVNRISSRRASTVVNPSK